MEIDYSIIGRRIKEIRKSKHYTQELLAEKADLTNNYISNIENCRSIPSLETLMKLCLALEITPNDVLLGANVSSQGFAENDLSAAFAKCTAPEKRLILDFIDILIKNRHNNS